MRFYKSLILLLGLALIASFSLTWIGCSSDEVTPIQSTAGDETDPDYLVVNEQLGAFIDSTLAITKSGFVNISQMATDSLVDPVNYGPIDPGRDSASSIYANGWHVVYIARVADTYRTAMRDSIQFRGQFGTPQQDAADMASMTYGHQWVWMSADTSVDFVNVDGTNRFQYNGLNTNEATINGTATFHVHSRNYSENPDIWPDRTRDFTFSTTFTDLTVPQTISGWSNSCPTSGMVAGSLEVSTQDGEGDAVVHNWTYTVSFSNGVATQTVRRGNVYWTSTYSACTISGS